MNELQQLHADLLVAASTGAEHAGSEAVQAGVSHTDNAGRALLNVESVSARFAGAMEAQVIASQPSGITDAGPVLPGTEGTADLMAQVAAEAGAAALGGK